MSRVFSLNTLRSLYEPETGNWPVVLLTLDHPDLAAALRVSSDATRRVAETEQEILYGTVSRGETYFCYPFDLLLPSDEEGGTPNTRLSVDNVSPDITDAIRDLTSPPTALLEVVMGQSCDTVEMGLPDFRLVTAEWDRVQVTGELSLEALLNEKMGRAYRPGSHPGVFK